MTAATVESPRLFGDFTSEVEKLSRTRLARCLQCGKCSSGCPVADRADYRPHQLLRLVQLGQRETVLSSRMIWACTTCHTCGTRCPQSVDIGAMNDALRRMSSCAAMVRVESAVPTFNRLFLKSIRQRGRVYEFGLLAWFKLLTLRLFDDLGKFVALLLKGKISILPRRPVSARAMKKLFARVEGKRN